jgi:predicted NodU family carbamoyl transferase
MVRPDEAINCFLRTEVEWLVLGNLLVQQPTALWCDT